MSKSIVTELYQAVTIEINHYRATSGGNDRNFDRYHFIYPYIVRYGAILGVPLGNGRSAYRYAVGPVPTTRIGWYYSKLKTLVDIISSWTSSLIRKYCRTIKTSKNYKSWSNQVDTRWSLGSTWTPDSNPSYHIALVHCLLHVAHCRDHKCKVILTWSFNL